MYPDFEYFLEGIFHHDMPSFLGVLKTFGFFVAIAFLLAASVLKRELRRMERAGLLQPELLPYARAKKYVGKTGPVKTTADPIAVYPHQRVGEIIVLALIGGVVGAKIFNALETWQDFIRDPVGNLLSGSGLTFYGGLIVAALLILRYLRRHRISIVHFCDAIAPALMLAYGVGRLGCHFSGDGDWGMFNSAYVSLPDASLKQVPSGVFSQAILGAADYFRSNFGSLTDVPHAYMVAPSGWPQWLVAMNFPHNVISEGVLIGGCTGPYCHVLPVPVFPTSLYEAVLCTLLFALLWSVRRKFRYAGHLFGLYLILNGVERFFIEKIKVNYRYDWGFLHPAQSEIIAVVLVLVGLGLLLFYRKVPVHPRAGRNG